MAYEPYQYVVLGLLLLAMGLQLRPLLQGKARQIKGGQEDDTPTPQLCIICIIILIIIFILLALKAW